MRPTQLLSTFRRLMAHIFIALHRPPDTTRPRLPPELIDMIIDFLHDDVQSLLACTLVSRFLLPSSRVHLFHFLGCTIKDPIAFPIITTTLDIRLRYISQLNIVGERIHDFTFERLEALLDHLPHLRRISLQGVKFLEVPLWPPKRSGPFVLEELQLLECDATIDNYAHLFRILWLFSSVNTLYITSNSTAYQNYSFHPIPDWTLDPVHVAVQHLHTFDIPFPIIETLLNTLARARALQTFGYNDDVLRNAGDGVNNLGDIMASFMTAPQQLYDMILGPLEILKHDSPDMQQGLEAMQLGSIGGLQRFQFLGYLLELQTAGKVFSALPESVVEARFVVVDLSFQQKGFLKQYHEFTKSFNDELVRRAEMVFVLDLRDTRRKLSKKQFASLRKEAEKGLRSLRLAAPGRVRIEYGLEKFTARVPVCAAPEFFPENWI